MKRIGLLGRMSLESSIECYRLVNDAVRDRPAALGGQTAVSRVGQGGELQRTGRWEEAGAVLPSKRRRTPPAAPSWTHGAESASPPWPVGWSRGCSS
jgi:aspartate/glutamate racemase